MPADDRDPDDDGAPPRRPSSRAAALLAFAAPLAPLVTVMALLIAWGLPDYALDGDGALIELRVRNAAAGQQLLGSYSRLGFDHPGPLHFYLCVPLYVATGGSAMSLNLSTVLIHCTAIVALLALCARAGGRSALAVASMMTTAYVAMRGQALLVVWDPALALMPTLAAWVAWAAFAAGIPAGLPIAVLASSLAAQAYLGLVPSVGIAATTAIALRIAARRGLPPLRPAVIALSVGLGLASLAPTLIEQCTGEPGNLTRIVRALGGEGQRPSLATAVDLAAERLGAFGSWASAGVLPAALVACLQLGLLLPIAVGWRRRRLTTALARVAVALHVAALLAIRGIVGDIAPHMLVWIDSVGLLSCCAIGMALLPRRRGRHAAVIVVTAAALLIAALGARDLGRATRVFAALPMTAAATPDLAAAVAEVAGKLRALQVDRVTVVAAGRAVDDARNWTFVTGAGVVLALEKHGIRAQPIQRHRFAFPDPDTGPPAETLLRIAGPFDPAPHADPRRVVAREGWSLTIVND